MAPSSDAAARERFETLVAEVYVPLRRYLRRRTDLTAADDIPDEAPVAWCYGVARGCLANSVRGTQRHQRLLRRLTAVAAPVTSPPSEDPREIAVVLGITPNAVSIRLHRATRRLRVRLQGRKDAGPGGHLGQRQGTEAPR